MKSLLLILVIGLVGCSSKPFKTQTLGEKMGTVAGWTFAAPVILVGTAAMIKYGGGAQYINQTQQYNQLQQHNQPQYSGFTPDAYGPGVGSTIGGRAVKHEPFLKLKKDAYGMGVSSDQYGRPVKTDIFGAPVK